MRISDWSSDVCSSDLPGLRKGRPVDQRHWQISGLQLLSRRRHVDRRQTERDCSQRSRPSRRQGAAAMTVFFYVAATIAVIATVLVIFGRNTVNALLNLVVSLLGVSAMRSEARRVGKEGVSTW